MQTSYNADSCYNVKSLTIHTYNTGYYYWYHGIVFITTFLDNILWSFNWLRTLSPNISVIMGARVSFVEKCHSSYGRIAASGFLFCSSYNRVTPSLFNRCMKALSLSFSCCGKITPSSTDQLFAVHRYYKNRETNGQNMCACINIDGLVFKILYILLYKAFILRYWV